MAVPKLFTPIQVGRSQLSHRVVLCPMTRGRADAQHVQTPLAVEYYAQRASMPGSLLITEATSIAQKAIGLPNVPGIWSDAHIAAWKPVSARVPLDYSIVGAEPYRALVHRL